ncbi:hypothetical protein FEM48_Zijuj03G0031600 [Ziziphus jujuba var. spinosa]|uniref:Uncharacterized protein n=1 Tax=Ziziphus jujuba var. spinosa TaxID=714518 RepID=A0A978VMU1_ZIZJJ|nr:hypothetical protein FEM48_Zijuj03G0031600 [Ziziphus jujuba var. spinosa]
MIAELQSWSNMCHTSALNALNKSLFSANETALRRRLICYCTCDHRHTFQWLVILRLIKDVELELRSMLIKTLGAARVSAYGGPSSSQSAGEPSLSTSSKKGGLKCQSSVLDNDIGSIGPPVSGSLSIPKTGLGSVAAQTPSSSIQKLNSSGELKNDYEEASTENEESTMSCTSFSSVPTKSSGMDSKMLQQLDKLVLPKDELSEPNLLTSMDKSLTNMSPSVPHGQALKSLEAVDSSNYLGDEQDKKKLDASLDKKVPDARDTTSLEQDTVEESGRLKIVASCDKATDVVNDVDSAVPKKITSMNIETTVYSNGAVSHSSADGTQKVDTFSAERKSHNTEAVILEKPPLAFLECKPSTSAVNNKPDPETSDGSSPLTSDAASPPMVSNVALSIFNFGDKVASTKDSDAASPTCSFGSKPTDEVPETFTTFASSPAVVTESGATECGSFPEQKPETSSR